VHIQRPGDVKLAGARFRHIYIDGVVGSVDFTNGRADTFVAIAVNSRLAATGARIGGGCTWWTPQAS